MSMHATVSKDGTIIAYDRLGDGPPVVMVAGAFNDRATTAPLAVALQDRFTVLNPDRRGRGDSGDSDSYAVEREIEDLDSLIGEAGGSAALFGYSSGAMLALRAAAYGDPVHRYAAQAAVRAAPVPQISAGRYRRRTPRMPANLCTRPR